MVNIKSFTVDKIKIVQGESIVFSWEIEGATSLILMGDKESTNRCLDIKTSSITLIPSSSDTYRLWAKDSNGQDQRAIDIMVSMKPADPRIISFSANKQTIYEGQVVTFSWKTEGASVVSLNWEGMSYRVVAGNADIETDPKKTGVYVLRATEGDRTVEASISITVLTKPIENIMPEIQSFSVDKSDVYRGDSVTFSWKVVNAEYLELSHMEANNRKAQEVTNLDGSVSIIIVSPTVYTLYARKGDKIVQADIPIAISNKPADKPIAQKSSNVNMFNIILGAIIAWAIFVPRKSK